MDRQQFQGSRQRVLNDAIITGWDGTGTKTINARNHQSLPHHQISILADSVPAAGTIRVRAKPVGMPGFCYVSATLDSTNLATNGSVVLSFYGWYEAYSLDFTVALSAGRTVSAMLSSGDGLL